MGFLFPSAHVRIGGPLDAGVAAARYVPSSGFGYPRDGLLPPSPSRSCFVPTALMGFTLRSVPLSKGTRAFPHRMHPLVVSPAGVPVDKAKGRPNRPRLPGFDPSESPWRSDGLLARQPLDAPLGFALLGPSHNSLAGDINPGSSHVLWNCDLRSRLPAPRSINRLSLRPIHAVRKRTKRTGQPLQGLRTCTIPNANACLDPGLCLRLMPRRTSLPTDQQSLGR
jgi:hypothetical protein